MNAELELLAESAERLFADHVTPTLFRSVEAGEWPDTLWRAVTAAGFAVSTDGGQSYTYRFPSLDQSRDTTVTYGVSTLPAIPTVLAQGSAPLDLALTADADTIYAAALLASGLGDRSGYQGFL